MVPLKRKPLVVKSISELNAVRTFLILRTRKSLLSPSKCPNMMIKVK